MAAIDMTGKQYVCITNNEAGMVSSTIKDSGTSKEYLISLQSGVLKLTNIADDTEVLSFSADA